VLEVLAMAVRLKSEDGHGLTGLAAGLSTRGAGVSIIHPRFVLLLTLMVESVVSVPLREK
jgi:hypothetical protein